MEQEFDFFSQYIGNDSDDDSLFIKITTNVELSMSSVKPISLSIVEQFNKGTPSVVFDVVDGNGELSNHNLPISETVFTLHLGRSMFEVGKIKLRMTKMDMINNKGGGSEQITYRMFFVHHGWDKMVGQYMNRGWEAANASGIVSGIVSDSGWTETDFAQCDSTEDVIQPHWTNMRLIKWLAGRNVIKGGVPKYCGRVDGTFLFHSIESLIEKYKDEAMRGEIPVIRMQGQDDPYVREDGRKDNQGIPEYFSTYSVDEAHATTRLGGGGGVKSFTYDSHTDTFMIDRYTIKDLTGHQLSDWTSVSDGMVEADVFLYNGRGGDNKTRALSKIGMATDSAVRIDIVTEGSLNIKCGQMIEVIIPTPREMAADTPYNIHYSGFYIIGSVTHFLNFKKNTMMSNLTVIRSGHDSKRIEGYDKTSTGKFVNT